MFDWVEEFNGAVTVCDLNFKIVYMNEASKRDFEKWGGADLLGKNLLDCHNPTSCAMMKEQLKNGRSHTYIKEKADGRKKVIHQAPWFLNQKVSGLIEVSFYMA